jgi:hypothetical protein
MNTPPQSESMDRARAIQLHNEACRLNDLLTWTIYAHPSDMPDKFVARPHSMKHNAPLLHHIEANDIETLREMLPPGRYRVERAPTDDPVIVETWI